MYNFLWQRLKNQPRSFKDWIYPLGNKIITRKKKKKPKKKKNWQDKVGNPWQTRNKD